MKRLTSLGWAWARVRAFGGVCRRRLILIGLRWYVRERWMMVGGLGLVRCRLGNRTPKTRRTSCSRDEHLVIWGSSWGSRIIDKLSIEYCLSLTGLLLRINLSLSLLVFLGRLLVVVVVWRRWWVPLILGLVLLGRFLFLGRWRLLRFTWRGILWVGILIWLRCRVLLRWGVPFG